MRMATSAASSKRGGRDARRRRVRLHCVGAVPRQGRRPAGPPRRRRKARHAARRDAPGRRAPHPARRAHLRRPRRAPGRRGALHHRALRPRRRSAVHAAHCGRGGGHGGDRVVLALPAAHRAQGVS
jgi:hypothetical protein